jgi:hypothetical protein
MRGICKPSMLLYVPCILMFMYVPMLDRRMNPTESQQITHSQFQITLTLLLILPPPTVMQPPNPIRPARV